MTLKKYSQIFNTYYFFKMLNVGLGSLVFFAQFYYLESVLETELLAFALSVFFIIPSLSFLDFGIIHPLYVQLRRRFFQSKQNVIPLPELVLLLLVAWTATIIFAILVSAYGWLLKIFGHLNFAAIFSSICLYFFITNFWLHSRYLFEALDKYMYWEKTEIVRKFLLVGIFFMPDYFDSLGLAISLYSILLLGIFLIGYWAAFEEMPVLNKTTVLKTFISTIPAIKNDRRNVSHNLQFRITDSINNNIGVMIAPILFSSEVSVIVNLWFRIYRGLAMIYRSYIESKIPRLTSVYIKDGTTRWQTEIRMQLRIVFLLTLALSTFIVLFGDSLIDVLSEGVSVGYSFYWLIAGAFIVNGVTHTVSSNLLVVGDFYEQCRRVSAVGFLLLSSAVVVLSLIHDKGTLSFVGFLFCYLSVFLFMSVLYLKVLTSKVDVK